MDQTHLFQKYIDGTLSQKEEEQLVIFVSQSETNHLAFKEYIANNQYSSKQTKATLVAWQRISKKLKSASTTNNKAGLILPVWARIAALVAISLVLGYLSGQLIDIKDVAQSNELIVPKGENARLVLSDGTNVYLQAGTTLKYPSAFTNNKREVELVGEAFFDVVKDQSNPFIITTPEFKVKVTGTSFNLKTYVEDEWNDLVLHSGKVTIENRGQQIDIKPGEKYSFSPKHMQYKITDADLQKSMLRKKGVTVIEDLSLVKLQVILEREYNVKIRIENETIKDIRYSGQFKPHETILDVLKLIRDASPIKFKYEFNEEKDVVTMY